MPYEEVKMPEFKNWEEYIKHYPAVAGIKEASGKVWKKENDENSDSCSIIDDQPSKQLTRTEKKTR